MSEIKRMQQLAGIITEIKVNSPNKLSILKKGLERVLEGDKEFGDEDQRFEIDDYIEKIRKSNNEDELEEILSDYLHNDSEMIQDYLAMALEKSESPFLKEDISDFNIGQSSETGGRKTTVTDIDPETQSVTWSVKKELDDKDIHKDLTSLINKFETIQIKDFHSRPKLIQLIKDLKTIRNKFSRTVIKEDRSKLIKTLKGILNEIKVNNPNIFPKLINSIDQEKSFLDMIKSEGKYKWKQNYPPINYQHRFPYKISNLGDNILNWDYIIDKENNK